MITQGRNILFRLCCPDCGQPLENSQPSVSDFFIINCSNKDCHSYRADILVERRTGIVLSAHYHEIKAFDGKSYRYKMEEIK